MNYNKLPEDHCWEGLFHYLSGYRMSYCAKCKQKMFKSSDAKFWKVQSIKYKLVNCELMQAQIKMDEALS